MHIQPERTTELQKEVLFKILDQSKWPSIQTMTKMEASDLIHNHCEQWPRDVPTPKQKGFLKARNLWKDGMRKGEAWLLIGRIMKEEEKKK